MTPNEIFRLYRGYKFFYDDAAKFTNEGKPILKHPPLESQHDRQYFHRLAHKLADNVVHALFTVGFFYNPRAHVSELTSPEALKLALVFAGRGENGPTMLSHDLYDLSRPYMEPGDDKEALLRTWLYGERGQVIPDCLMSVINGNMALDVASLIFLIPQPTLDYNWSAHWLALPDLGLGAQPWIRRLLKTDQLLRMQRPWWRVASHTLAREFWDSMSLTSLAPVSEESKSLYTLW